MFEPKEANKNGDKKSLCTHSFGLNRSKCILKTCVQ